MSDPEIHLALTDDWELRGDGSGDMRAMQFATIRELVSIYNEFGLRGTFMAEVMQQLEHRRLGKMHPELGALADEWDATLRSVHSQGHDVQLHLHLHWHKATFERKQWILSSPWSVSAYSAANLRSMVESAKSYLEDLLRPVDRDYRCCAFRAGSYLAVPSDNLFSTMAELGLIADVSVVPGWHIDSSFLGQRLLVDYRQVEEPFLPYYPEPSDFRHKGQHGPVHCMPTHSFHFNVTRKLQRRLMSALGVARNDLRRPSDLAPKGAGGNIYDRRAALSGSKRLGWAGKLGRVLAPAHRISDLSQLSFWEAKLMLQDIRRRARRSSWNEVPVVISNHTKNIGDFGPIRRFAEYVAAAKDIRVLTLREICDNLLSGCYQLRSDVGCNYKKRCGSLSQKGAAG
jgi:hypothetical protein